MGKLTQKYPFLAGVKIPANTLQGPDRGSVNRGGERGSDRRQQLKEDMVYNLTKALFENQAELASAHAKGRELNLQYAVKGVSIPFHPGAVKYYKEKGLMK